MDTLHHLLANLCTRLNFFLQLIDTSVTTVINDINDTINSIETAIQCDICAMDFENEEDFMSHRLSEHGNVSELDIMKTCDICNKEFANLKLHKTMKHMQVRVHTIVEFSDYLIKVE